MAGCMDADWEARAEAYITGVFAADSSGHDIWHSIRVYRTAMSLRMQIITSLRAQLYLPRMALYLQTRTARLFLQTARQSLRARLILSTLMVL